MANDTSWKFTLSRTGSNLYKVVRRRAGRAQTPRGMRPGTGDSILQALLNPLLTLVAALAMPAIILVLALWLEDATLDLASDQLRLLAWFPAVVFAIGIGMALRFNRARILSAQVNLAIGYAAIVWLLPSLDSFDHAALAGLLLLLLPLNHLACHVLPDHAAVSSWRFALLAVLAVEALVFVLIAGTDWDSAVSLLHVDLFHFAEPGEIGLSDIGFLAAVILLTLSFARLYALTNTQRAALFASGYCLVIVLANLTQPATAIAFTAAGALLLSIAGFQESWNIAYLDQLTELPGRRALEEALSRLEGHYAVAMVDVDHFKKFNDTYGHDVGDQVLRMVASRLREVGGGGKAYRYGGEEFTVLFPGRGAEEAFPAVEALRELIADDVFEIRRRERRQGDESEVPTQPAGAGGIRITISAGLAERPDRSASASAVIKSADEALYAAKRGGRNRVSRAR